MGHGAEIILFDAHNRQSGVRMFRFVGKLWFFDFGESTEVGEDVRLLGFSFGDYNPDPRTLRLCTSGNYFILSSGSRRFRIEFPFATFAALILEIE
jgi:hypothetical protein